MLQPDGHLDRKRLGAIVFGDPEKRKRLEAITHPAIRRAPSSASSSVYEEEAFEGVVHLGRRRCSDRVGRRASDGQDGRGLRRARERELARLMARDGLGDEEARGAHREPDAGGGQGEARRLRDRQLGHRARRRSASVREVYRAASSPTCNGARAPAR